MNYSLNISQLEDEKQPGDGCEHYESQQNIEDTPIGTAGNQHSINFDMNQDEESELSLSSPLNSKHQVQSSLGDIVSNRELDSQLSLSLPMYNIA